MTVLTSFQGLIVLLSYALAMIALSLWTHRGRRNGEQEFLLASRQVGVFSGSLSIAASWIWAPALFLSSQTAYEKGLPGIFWFIVPNLLSLMLFAPLALRIRRALPEGFTLPELIKLRHGKPVHRLYVIQFLGTQVYSFAIQILAGAGLIQIVTGLPYHLISIVLATTALCYSSIGGLRASVATDAVQMLIIFLTLAISIPWAIAEAGGLSTLISGLGGKGGEYKNLFDPWIAYSFGIPVTIGLLAGPIADQQHWQRALALKNDKDVIKTFIIAALLFAIVPISLSLLGFLAANPNISSEWSIPSSQMIGPIAISQLLPSLMIIPFTLMLICGLSSTMDSALCATAALSSIDVVSGGSSKKKIRIIRIAMLLLTVISLSITFIPGLTILHLFLFYATWRASTMIPTILTLFDVKLDRVLVFYAILASFLLGTPLYAAGAILENPHLKVIGSVLVLLIGLITIVRPRNARYYAITSEIVRS